MMMNGRSIPLRCRTSSAAGALKRGIDQSEKTMSHPPRSSCSSRSSASWTRTQCRWYPLRSSA